MKRIFLFLLLAFAAVFASALHAQGTAVTYAGSYNPATTYPKSAIALENGVQYITLQTGVLNHDPATSPSYWAPLNAQTARPSPAIANFYAASALAYANALANSSTFSGGSLNGGTLLSAGPGYAQYGMYAVDGLRTVYNTPWVFSTDQKVAWVNLWFNQLSPNGDLVIAIPPSGVVDQTANGQNNSWDTLDAWKHHANGDGWISIGRMFPLILAEDRAKGIALWNAHGAAMMAALSRIPRNGNTHMLTVTAGDEYIPCTGFQETARDTGDVSCENVWYLVVANGLTAVAAAAADSASVTSLNASIATIAAGIPALIDPATGMLVRDTGQLSTNLDVEASAAFCFYGLGTAAQCNRIATYFDTNYSSLVNAAGYIRQSQKDWSVVGSIGSNGATVPGTACNGTYQCGFWSLNFLEFNAVLASVDPVKAQQQLAAYVAGPNPTTEYFNVGDAAPHGTTNNLVSTSGPLALAANNVPPKYIPQATDSVTSSSSSTSTTTAAATYGTPTFTSLVPGLSVPSSGWAIDDHTFVFIFTPPGSFTGDTLLGVVTFGKRWVDANGTQVYANCQISSRLAAAAGVPLYYADPGNGSMGAIAIHTGASAAVTGGVTYAWVVSCTGTEQ